VTDGAVLNTVLFDKFTGLKHLPIGSPSGHGDEALLRHAPPSGARLLDIGCRVGDHRMLAMWRKDGNRWNVMPPTGFPDEAPLHKLVEADPDLLPLAGSAASRS
jgi:hypothetical protein